jgi:LysM repeat protein
MKTTLLFAMLSVVFAVPGASAATELETLRARCLEQEREIRRLEEQLGKTRATVSAQPTPVTRSAPAAGNPAVHVVRTGESMERIARRNGCSAAALAKANGLKLSAMIHPGQKLKLPGGVATASRPAVASAAAAGTTPALAGKTHQIRAGETYSSIARKYRTSAQLLIAANPGVKATSLRPGQVIRLSSASAVQAAAPAIAAAPASQVPVRPPAVAASAPAPAPAAAAPSAAVKPEAVAAKSVATPPAPVSVPVSAPAPAVTQAAAPAPVPPANEAAAATPSDPAPAGNVEKKIRSVTIDGETSYGEFAAKYGTDTDRLNDLNGLDLTHSTVLAKGSELYVPAQP